MRLVAFSSLLVCLSVGLASWRVDPSTKADLEASLGGELPAIRKPTAALVDASAARRIKTTIAIPIIVVTTNAMPGDRERCLEVGADDYLTKPVSAQALRDAIERFVLNPAGSDDGAKA
jgi:hypothetical protein